MIAISSQFWVQNKWAYLAEFRRIQTSLNKIFIKQCGWTRFTYCELPRRFLGFFAVLILTLETFNTFININTNFHMPDTSFLSNQIKKFKERIDMKPWDQKSTMYLLNYLQANQIRRPYLHETWMCNYL